MILSVIFPQKAQSNTTKGINSWNLWNSINSEMLLYLPHQVLYKENCEKSFTVGQINCVSNRVSENECPLTNVGLA